VRWERRVLVSDRRDRVVAEIGNQLRIVRILQVEDLFGPAECNESIDDGAISRLAFHQMANEIHIRVDRGIRFCLVEGGFEGDFHRKRSSVFKFKLDRTFPKHGGRPKTEHSRQFHGIS